MPDHVQNQTDFCSIANKGNFMSIFGRLAVLLLCAGCVSSKTAFHDYTDLKIFSHYGPLTKKMKK